MVCCGVLYVCVRVRVRVCVLCVSVLCVLVMADFGQTDFGQPTLASLFGRPSLAKTASLTCCVWCGCVWCVVWCCVCAVWRGCLFHGFMEWGFTCGCWFQSFGLVMFGAPWTALPRTALPLDHPKFRLFSPLPPQNSFFSSLSGGLLVDFWWCFLLLLLLCCCCVLLFFYLGQPLLRPGLSTNILLKAERREFRCLGFRCLGV